MALMGHMFFFYISKSFQKYFFLLFFPKKFFTLFLKKNIFFTLASMGNYTDPIMMDLRLLPETQDSPVVIDLSSQERDSESPPDTTTVFQSEPVSVVTPSYQLPERSPPVSSISRIFPPSGLCNLGNTCSANAIL